MGRFEATDDLVAREVKKRAAAKARREAEGEGGRDEMAIGDEVREDLEVVERRMEMARRGRMLALQITLDRGAAMVASLDPAGWFRWTVYFVKTVECLLSHRKVDADVREEFLRQLYGAMTDRVLEGEW